MTFQFISANEKGPFVGEIVGSVLSATGSCIINFMLSGQGNKKLHTFKTYHVQKCCLFSKEIIKGLCSLSRKSLRATVKIELLSHWTINVFILFIDQKLVSKGNSNGDGGACDRFVGGTHVEDFLLHG